MKQGFFAYSSHRPQCAEAIKEAIKQINNSKNAKILSWEGLKISGRMLINPILKKIDDSDFICVDLTGMNKNVLFELGYSIGRKKPIFLIHDDSIIESQNRFRELDFLRTVGYSSYRSTRDIVRKFYEEEVVQREDNLFDEITATISETENKSALLYLKGQYDTNYSQIITNQLDNYSLPSIIDDPSESKVQPLTWYVEQLYSVPAVLSELSSTHRSGHELHNIKCSFISGLALGLDLRLQMIAEMPFESPLDYKELLIKFNNKRTCQEAVEPFLKDLKNDIANLFTKKRRIDRKRRKRSKLQKIKFGEYIAEHEVDNLYEYYVETIHYQNILKSEYNIVIGRKGTGKTATLYYIKDVISEETKNHVCLTKPINFEIEGLTILLTSLDDEFERGFLIEAIWKFLIYTEIAKSLYERINEKQPHTLTEEDFKFTKYVKDNHNIILTDFSTRLEQEIQKLESINSNTQQDFRIKVSEILHEGIISDLREYIISVTSDIDKLVVLMDNIDKSWRKGSNLRVLSKYILGLLGVVGRIAKELKNKGTEQGSFTFHLTLFLRSDIFEHVLNYAREPDKIEYTRLRWDDKEVFFRLIEERLMLLSDFEVDPVTFWSEYITDKVKGEAVKDYINKRIIPRPRDIIFFFNSAKNTAVSRGHEAIDGSDLQKAYEDYSNWVFKSILVENGITVEEMENFLFELVGENAIITEQKIKNYMQKAGLKTNDTYVEHFISHLESLSLIGPEIGENEFIFDYDFEKSKKIKRLSEKYGSNRYRINNPFIPFLECTTDS